MGDQFLKFHCLGHQFIVTFSLCFYATSQNPIPFVRTSDGEIIQSSGACLSQLASGRNKERVAFGSIRRLVIWSMPFSLFLLAEILQLPFRAYMSTLLVSKKTR